MTIERLRCFTTVTKHLNFTRAAAELHMAQTAVSRQIAALEAELGCRLFERNNRTVALTPAGKCFLEGIGPLLELYDKTLAETREVGRTVGGELRIGIGQYEGWFVSRLVEEFCRAYPRVEVEISTHRYQELTHALLTGRVDIAFALPVSAEYLENEEVEILPLFTSDVCVVLRRDHPLAEERLFRPEWFREECLITLSEEDGPCSLESLKEKMRQGNIVFKNMRCANSLRAELLMVETGMGIAVMPRFLREELPEKVKMISTTAWYPGKDKFVAIRRTGKQKLQVETFWNGIAGSRTLLEQMERLKAGEL